MEILNGKITAYDGHTLTIQATYENMDEYVRKQPDRVRFALVDGRSITDNQRRKIYAMLNEIAEWIGDLPEQIKHLFKWKFVQEQMQGFGEYFSLSNVDETTASAFISYLVEFIIVHGVPCSKPLYELCDDIRRYVYFCAKSKKCCVCGRKTELHHVDAVGMGRDRNEIQHVGMRMLPLCERHHQEAHAIGNASFLDRYHIEPIEITDELVKIYKLRSKKV